MTKNDLRNWSVAMALFFAALAVQAIGYDEARDRAWYLTDKMAYELDLTSEQRDAAYRINLDYLLSVGSASDCFGPYWGYRNADLRCVLTAAQYRLYVSLDYFYKPLLWSAGVWFYPVVRRYRPGCFYYRRPAAYVCYHGAGWRHRRPAHPSPYVGFRPGPRPPRPAHRPPYGRGGRPSDVHPGPRPHRRPQAAPPVRPGAS